jgi:hypothetical protein
MRGGRGTGGGAGEAAAFAAATGVEGFVEVSRVAAAVKIGDECELKGSESKFPQHELTHCSF